MTDGSARKRMLLVSVPLARDRYMVEGVGRDVLDADMRDAMGQAAQKLSEKAHAYTVSGWVPGEIEFELANLDVEGRRHSVLAKLTLTQ